MSQNYLDFKSQDSTHAFYITMNDSRLPAVKIADSLDQAFYLYDNQFQDFCELPLTYHVKPLTSRAIFEVRAGIPTGIPSHHNGRTVAQIE